MIILAIDPNVHDTGWCLYDTETEKKAAGTLRSPKNVLKREVEEAKSEAADVFGLGLDKIERDGKVSYERGEALRMRMQRKQIEEAIEAFGIIQPHVDVAVIEDVYMKHNPKVPITIRGFAAFIVGGLVRDIVYMSASTWRARLFKTNRREDKKTKAAASRWLGRDTETIDEATAACIMMAYLQEA